MKALLPDGHGSVVMGGAAEPVPRDDELLVGVEAFGVNRGETFLLDRPRPGRRPGKDVAGVVVRAAADGTGPAAGRRVVAHPPEGAAVTAVTRTAERGARLRELGAVEIVPDVAKAGGPFDVVVESVGGDVFGQAWSRLSPHGLLLWLGQASREAPVVDHRPAASGDRPGRRLAAHPRGTDGARRA